MKNTFNKKYFQKNTFHKKYFYQKNTSNFGWYDLSLESISDHLELNRPIKIILAKFENWSQVTWGGGLATWD